MAQHMKAPVPQSLIDAAETYETMFVPALFGQWAKVVADAAGIRAGERVLDVACGTGVLAREAAARVGATGHVAGADPHAGMIAVARRIARDIDWHEAPAEALPFAPNSFDAVVSQFGLMFFSDRDRAIRKMLRVLVPEGRAAVAVWDAIENVPAFADLVGLLDRTAGKAAGDALRAPFVLGDKAALGGLFEAAGARTFAIATHRGTARFPSIRHLVEAELRGWLPVMGVELGEETIEAILAEAEDVLSPYRASGGNLLFDISAHLVHARKLR
jgi:SAM-dependent methyltransferase